jgi:hypothetical protein
MWTTAESGRLLLCGMIALLALAVVLGGCRRGPPPTPSPPFETDINSTPHDEVLRYAQSLEYDTVYGAGDRQRLMLGRCPADCRYGPLVRIEPERGTAALDVKDLARGRIIARIINEDPTVGYPKLRLLPRDTVFWWVDRVDRDKKSGRSLFVSTRDTASSRQEPGPLVFTEHRGYQWRQAIARWVWSDADEGSWSACSKNGCCRPL